MVLISFIIERKLYLQISQLRISVYELAKQLKSLADLKVDMMRKCTLLYGQLIKFIIQLFNFIHYYRTTAVQHKYSIHSRDLLGVQFTKFQHFSRSLRYELLAG